MNIKDKLSNNPLAIGNAFNTNFHLQLQIFLIKFFLERILLIIMNQYLIYDTSLDNLLRQ